MIRRRHVPLPIGVGLFVLGLGVALDPALADALSVDGLVSALGHDYFLAAAVGVVALVAGLFVVGARSIGGFDRATPPATEEVPTGRPPGEAVDAAIDGLAFHDHLVGDARERARSQLREAAVSTIARVEGCPRTTARERVAEGTWTDDPEAARFLAREEASVSALRRFADALPGNSRFRTRSRRAALAILVRGEDP